MCGVQKSDELRGPAQYRHCNLFLLDCVVEIATNLALIKGPLLGTYPLVLVDQQVVMDQRLLYRPDAHLDLDEQLLQFGELMFVIDEEGPPDEPRVVVETVYVAHEAKEGLVELGVTGGCKRHRIGSSRLQHSELPLMILQFQSTHCCKYNQDQEASCEVGSFHEQDQYYPKLIIPLLKLFPAAVEAQLSSCLRLGYDEKIRLEIRTQFKQMRNEKLKAINRSIQHVLHLTPSQVTTRVKNQPIHHLQFKGCSLCEEVRRQNYHLKQEALKLQLRQDQHDSLKEELRSTRELYALKSRETEILQQKVMEYRQALDQRQIEGQLGRNGSIQYFEGLLSGKQ